VPSCGQRTEETAAGHHAKVEHPGGTSGSVPAGGEVIDHPQ
jgi:hypothetical protein